MGVHSLKIEGRLKSPEYVRDVVKIWRRLLDEGRGANKSEMRELERIFSRSGFTDGYYKGDLNSDMTGIRQKSDIAASRESGGGNYLPEKISVKASASFKLGEPSSFTIYVPRVGRREGYTVTAYGASAEPSLTSALNEQDVKARLCKMGNTYLSLVPEDIEITLDGDVNLPISSLNALRRSAAELAENYGRSIVNRANDEDRENDSSI
jgi:putative protease